MKVTSKLALSHSQPACSLSFSVAITSTNALLTFLHQALTFWPYLIVNLGCVCIQLLNVRANLYAKKTKGASPGVAFVQRFHCIHSYYCAHLFPFEHNIIVVSHIKFASQKQRIIVASHTCLLLYNHITAPTCFLVNILLLVTLSLSLNSKE